MYGIECSNSPFVLIYPLSARQLYTFPKDQSCKQAGLFLSQHLYMLSGAELLKQTEDGLPPGSLSLCYNERAVWFQQPSHAVISYINPRGSVQISS